MMELRDVEQYYGEKLAFKTSVLTLKEGEFVALVGPNGSGKSSMLKLLAGQGEASRGQVLLDGIELGTLTPAARSLRVAYFPQDRPMPNMDVYTLVSHGRFPHLRFGRVMQASDKEAVAEALALARLEDLAARPLHALSGGERQRAYLAMLIAQDAKLLLLDEPGTFLDIRYQLEVFDLLKKLNQMGKTVVCAIHDLPAAFTYAERVIMLDAGTVVAEGSTSEVAASDALADVFGVRLLEHAGAGLFRYHLVGAEGN